MESVYVEAYHTSRSASGALAYGRADVTTDRTVTISGIDVLHGEFTGNALSGRLESGYRILTPWLGLTPFAAGEFTAAHLPGYDEEVVTGSNNFALSYDSNDATASRTELGIRTDKSFVMEDAILTLRGRMAWAHNSIPTARPRLFSRRWPAPHSR